MRTALSGLKRMSRAAYRILAYGLAASSCLLLFAVLTAASAGPYSAATRHVFTEAAMLERGALACFFCTAFLSAFAEERLGQS